MYGDVDLEVVNQYIVVARKEKQEINLVESIHHEKK